MSLEKLNIYRVRNIKQATLSPSPGLNFIYGKNGSGKSAFLEAIFILGRARSYRSPSLKSVIQIQQPDLIVSAQSRQNNNSVISLGVQASSNETIRRIDQDSNISRSDLAYALPIQLLAPKSFQLLDAGPQFRREFMDWGIFNMHPEFIDHWRGFKRALAQRNSLLKLKKLQQIDVWNQELAQYGTIVGEYRKNYLEQLEPLVNGFTSEFSEIDFLEIKIVSGWDITQSYLKCLEADLDKDLRYGFTHSGPHRGDFILLCQNRIAKDYVSRGQLKLLVLALKLSQVTLLNTSVVENVCVLIDDITAELDSVNRQKLIFFLSQLNNQIFMTTNELIEFGDLSSMKKYKMFHVEHGDIKSA